MKADLNKLKDLIKKLNNAKILVVGDLALDEMVYGDTERISREAPVLILQHTHTKHILGGASNAAHNVSTINNGKVSVVGVIGNDYQADDLKKAFEEANIDCSSLIKDNERKTITKTRISGSCSHSITQQIVRIDRQTNAPIPKETEDKLIKEVERLIPNYDAIILSDYHIGTLSDNVIKTVINTAKKYSKKVIVDAQKDLNRYNGTYSMTPNLPDTQKHVGFYLKTKEDFLKAGNRIIEETNANSILITCGSEGMVVIEKNNKYTHIPVFNKSKVFDVTGAGDTVTATYTLALAIGAEPVYAAIIGNIAAGIVIKQFGCATTNIEEILSAIPNEINLEV
ncbi:MAG: D-glycero-beta-D-manno-heptose-7-phosphate kinase [Cyanobacteria bacterium SIG31]|nr:D-glycero-beta-D-manno-heptose-7-phosphate kinase [Cyanobacteria bacterium SIG31]